LHVIIAHAAGTRSLKQDSWCAPYKTWLQAYVADPLAGFPDTEKGRALGGESAAWGELVGPANLEFKLWPRAAAFGARLWNYDEVMSNSTASVAIGSHASRLFARGLNSDVSAERFCLLFPSMCYPPEEL
jgi:hexosaminidase